ncbi:hypothetical protein [Neobacillus sp. LXY-4]|uniref:hypothetical protein n=1 Tax=Neobacillus sp. LXY-4 TaxID=3379826 RepID=UPI003EDFF477
MKSLKIIMTAFLFTFVFAFFANIIVSADDFEDEKYEQYDEDDEKEGPFEEFGKMVGWGTAISMGAAGILLPVRRTTKTIVKKAPSAKKFVLTLSQFLGKRHVFFGIIALGLSLLHGVFMFLSEGELEGEAISGIGSVLFMSIAAGFGFALLKNKKTKRVRTVHITLLGITVLLGMFHIFI